MKFIIQYSICSAITFLVVILHNLHVKNVSVFKSNAFSTYVIVGFLANIFDLARCSLSLASAHCPHIVYYLLNSLYYSTVILLPVVFVIYCFALVEYPQDKFGSTPQTSYLILSLPVIFTIIYIWVCPFFEDKSFSIYYFLSDPTLIQNGSIGYLILYITSGWYILMGFSVIIKNRHALDKYDSVHFHMIFQIMIVTVLVQRIFPYARVLSLATAMSCLDISFYIQRPEDIYNIELAAFNEKGFQVMMRYLFSTRKKFHAINLVMDEAEFYEKVLGQKERTQIEVCIINSLKQFFKKNCSIFKLKFGQYAIVIKEQKNMTKEEALNYINNQISLHWGYSSVDLDLSFRICTIESGTDVRSCLEISDLMDYFANSEKFQGKTLQADSLDLTKMHSKSYLEKAIFDGLNERRFEVYYQPFYSAKEDKLTRAEALLRLRDENGNFVSPEEFIPIAEQNGSIFEIGRFVFTSVCKTLSGIKLEDFNIQKIDINLSVVQCIQEDLYKEFIEIKNQYKIPSQYIDLEITETATINSPEVLLKNMKHFEKEGIELSLDDYGCGHSNISYILSLPFKMIKIDKGIVWEAFENQRANVVLKSTIDMMKSLNMKIVAEGVETEAQSQQLLELGCDYLQGYYYSRPVDVGKFLSLMRK